jgi:hypothetical protein
VGFNGQTVHPMSINYTTKVRLASLSKFNEIKGYLCLFSFVIIILSSFSISGSAQSGPLQFSAPVTNAAPGTIIEVPIRVSGFDSVVGMQFSLCWDSLVLSFMDVTNYDLEKVELFDFYSQQAGSFNCVWQAEDVFVGYTVPNEHIIFTLQFEVLGAIGDSTALSFVGLDKENEALHVSDNLFDLDYQEGMVYIEEMSGVINFPADLLKMEVLPNPCKEWCDVQFIATEPMNVHLQLIDFSGRTVYQIDRRLEVGVQEVSLSAVEALPSGGYFLIVESGRHRSVRKMMIQK